MTTNTLSTAAIINIVALMLPVPSTASPIPDTLEPQARQIRPVQKTATQITPPESDGDHVSPHKVRMTSIDPILYVAQYGDSDRSTTLPEKIVGELRSWSLLSANWDGEGAAAPDAGSLKEAVSFVRLFGEGDTLPEPMLHASGHAGLFWKDDNLYADIKFLGDGRVAYYIERQGDKHKGVLKFDSQKMPAVFTTLLRA